jgi:multicomponent Na+:H+ antiporter subunit D
LIGVPLTAGFVSKWYLVLAALEAGLWPLVAVIMASSLLAVIYVWRLVETLYFQEAPAGVVAVEAPWAMLLPLWVLTGAIVLFGIDATWTGDTARAAAAALLEASR